MPSVELTREEVTALLNHGALYVSDGSFEVRMSARDKLRCAQQPEKERCGGSGQITQERPEGDTMQPCFGCEDCQPQDDQAGRKEWAAQLEAGLEGFLDAWLNIDRTLSEGDWEEMDEAERQARAVLDCRKRHAAS